MDRILAINGRDVASMEHTAVLDFLLANTVVVLTLERRGQAPDRNKSISAVSPSRVLVNRRDSVGRAPMPALYEEEDDMSDVVNLTVSRSGLQDTFGFSVGAVGDGRPGVVVTAVPATTGAELGLEPGDELISVDETNVEAANPAAVEQMLVDKATVQLVVRRESALATTSFGADGAWSNPAIEELSSLGPGTPAAGSHAQRRVRLERPSDGAGFGVQLGFTEQRTLVVRSVYPAGPADGKVDAGDCVSAINGVEVATMAPDESIRMIQAASILELDLNRSLTASVTPTRGGATELSLSEFSVTVTRPSLANGFGFGFASYASGKKYVSQVAMHCSAFYDLAAMDEILRFNGVPAAGLDHQAVLTMLQGHLSVELACARHAKHGSPGSLLFRKDNVGHERAREPHEPLNKPSSAASEDMMLPVVVKGKRGVALTTEEVTITRHAPSTPYGFQFSLGIDHRVRVRWVRDGSPADGKLQFMDMITMVNGSPVLGEPYSELVRRMSGGTQLRLVIERPRRVPAGSVGPDGRATTGDGLSTSLRCFGEEYGVYLDPSQTQTFSPAPIRRVSDQSAARGSPLSTTKRVRL